MKTIYKSKIGLEIALPLMALLLALIIVFAITGAWLSTGIVLAVSAFSAHVFLTTRYTIIEDKLRIRCGLMYFKTIDIKSIRKIEATSNPISSPAVSLDRLELSYGKFDSVLISPENKESFIGHLKSINENIDVKLKGK